MRVFAEICIDFESSLVDANKIDTFSKKFNQFMHDMLYDSIYDLAEESGFEIETMHPVYIVDDFHFIS